MSDQTSSPAVKAFLVLTACVLIVTFGLVINLILLTRGAALAEDVRDQARKNQHHTDCAITFALANDPPSCSDVKVDLARDGIPLTPGPASTDPTKNPSVAYIICKVAELQGKPAVGC